MHLPRSWLRRRPLLALIILVVLLAGGYAGRAVHGGSDAPARHPGVSGPAAVHAVALSSLPVQARQTVALIQRDGPFRYSQDGVVYQNLERQLPIEPAGFYHEYTVPTPGSADRGTRRIVTGGDGQFYYTGDHYASFVRITLTG